MQNGVGMLIRCRCNSQVRMAEDARLAVDADPRQGHVPVCPDILKGRPSVDSGGVDLNAAAPAQCRQVCLDQRAAFQAHSFKPAGGVAAGSDLTQIAFPSHHEPPGIRDRMPSETIME